MGIEKETKKLEDGLSKLSKLSKLEEEVSTYKKELADLKDKEERFYKKLEEKYPRAKNSESVIDKFLAVFEKQKKFIENLYRKIEGKEPDKYKENPEELFEKVKKIYDENIQKSLTRRWRHFFGYPFIGVISLVVGLFFGSQKYLCVPSPDKRQETAQVVKGGDLKEPEIILEKKKDTYLEKKDSEKIIEDLKNVYKNFCKKPEYKNSVCVNVDSLTNVYDLIEKLRHISEYSPPILSGEESTSPSLTKKPENSEEKPIEPPTSPVRKQIPSTKEQKKAEKKGEKCYNFKLYCDFYKKNKEIKFDEELDTLCFGSGECVYQPKFCQYYVSIKENPNFEEETKIEELCKGF